MAESGALDILPQIHSLVSDRLQVISYKWLSRNFSVSSNYAKRLLQEFADKYGNELKVIYSLSGWLKSDPQNYSVKLASGLKLEDVRQEFKDTCSVQVYSVQACIPKDLAVLWSAEFLQAEELFNEPSSEENCLRDNRFCGVSNSFVKRIVDGKHASPGPPRPRNVMGTAMQSKSTSILKDQPVQPHIKVVGQSSAKNESNKSDIDASAIINKPSKQFPVKEPVIAVQASKQKGQNGKALSGNTGSLACLWGRASAKPKALDPARESVNHSGIVAVTAEDQICANEAADAASSDDEEYDMYRKRQPNSSSSRKRRAVIDFSDDDDEENVISLASPDPPKEHISCSSSNAENIILEQKEHKGDIVDNMQEDPKVGNPGLSSDVAISGSKDMITGISLREKSHNHCSGTHTEKGKMDQNTNSASTSPKKRKVLKTQIDDRGREVTEVVWEGEAAASDKIDKHITDSDAVNRPCMPSKAQTTGKGDKPNPVGKTTGNKKPAKGGGKDAKQGNILSFFKKL
ncbi:uncharacterized protein [Typha latifolia]|uniref:uncharacterized protein n=1 Tax=Typha latifolia TaxID=4733 RepID=UPI003C303271